MTVALLQVRGFGVAARYLLPQPKPERYQLDMGDVGLNVEMT